MRAHHTRTTARVIFMIIKCNITCVIVKLYKIIIECERLLCERGVELCFSFGFIYFTVLCMRGGFSSFYRVEIIINANVYAASV